MLLTETDGFWYLVSTIMEALHIQVSRDYLRLREAITNSCQNLEEQFSHLISDLPTLCSQAFQRADQDPEMTLLVYETHYSYVLRVDASNPALGFPLEASPDPKHYIRQFIKKFDNSHPEQQNFVFKGEHYATVAESMICSLLDLQ